MEKTKEVRIRSRNTGSKFRVEDYDLLTKEGKLRHQGSRHKGTVISSGVSDLDLVAVIDAASSFAISSIIISNLLTRTELSSNLLAGLFEITAKTLAKYKKEKLKLPTRHAELAVKLDILYALGSELFGSTKNFNKWLNEKSYGLNDKIPIEMLNSVTGIEAVTDELKRIEYGATA